MSVDSVQALGRSTGAEEIELEKEETEFVLEAGSKTAEDGLVAGGKAGLLQKVTRKMKRWGLETNGIQPVPPEQRTDRRLYQMFFVWFSANLNILTMTTGTAGPAYYGLGIRDSLLVILVVDVVVCAIPAFFAVFGPKLGTRGMVAARFSWGYYGALIPSILVVVDIQGYLVLNTIVGGQTLGAISTHLNASLGIVIIGIVTLMVVFSGYKVLHWYEMFVWFPNVVAFVVMLGVSGKHLIAAPLSGPSPPTASQIMTFGATVAASVANWSPLTADQGVYHDCNASAWRVFMYSYLGLLLSSMPVQMLGAVWTAGADFVPAWKAGLGNGNDIGGLLGAVLLPVGGFGKFLLVLLSLTTPSQCAPAMYAMLNSFMALAPVLARMPRPLLAIVSTAIMISVGIVGSSRFYSIFSDILAFVGYWLAPFCSIVLTEHFIFRKSRFASYDVLEAWNKPDHPNLPRSYASSFTFAATVGFIVLCMQKQWWTGPIARTGTGDVGMLLGFLFGVLVYTCTRWAEKTWEARARARSPR